MVDHTLAAAESALLGREFLTWLWYKAEALNGLFKAADGKHFTVFMEQKVTVTGGEGESKETASSAGAHSELVEARLGLRTGKKVDRALLKFDQDGQTWTVQVRAEEFALNSLRTPKIETKREEGEDPDGAFLEKIYLVETATAFFDTVYETFLRLRLSPAKWEEEVKAFRVWLQKT